MPDANDDYIYDAARLQEIADLDLFSDDAKTLVSDLVEEGARRLKLPFCSISIVLDEAQFLLSMFGARNEMIAASDGTPLEWSFCRNVVEAKSDFVVSNALENDKMKDSPLVQVDGTRCYLGVPMVTSRGYVIGSFCAHGTESRQFDEQDIAYMRKMAREAVRRFEERVGRELQRLGLSGRISV